MKTRKQEVRQIITGIREHMFPNNLLYQIHKEVQVQVDNDILTQVWKQVMGR